MKKLIKFWIVILVVGASSCEEDSVVNMLNEIDSIVESKELVAKEARKLTVDIISPIEGLNITGSSTLHRNNKGITVNFKANGLKPGYAYTLWWVIWNKPDQCNTPYSCNDTDFANAAEVGVDILYAAGHVIEDDGIGNFSGRLNENDSAASVNALMGLPWAGGLMDSKMAEVHLVLRNHGPLIPGEVNDQINSYVGGCDNPFAIPPFTEDADEIGECADIVFAIHPSPQG